MARPARLLPLLAALLFAGVAAAASGTETAPGQEPAGDPARLRAADRRQAVSLPAGMRPAPVTPGRGRLGTPAVVDTGAVSAFGAAADEQGRVWLAVADRDARLRVYRADRPGADWDELFEYLPGTDVPRIEVVTGPGDSGCVFVFFLTVARAGELRALRIGPGDTLDVREFDVAVGPDTITSFAVAADRDRHYYLYCLYANELRDGRNAAFTRSLDFGKSWELPQSWWNCWDPALAYGSGSTVHAAWRYAANGREIHVQTSRYFGRPRYWWDHRRVSRSAARCVEPVITQLDTGFDARAGAWVAWTVTDRTGRRRDIEFSRSDDGGANWLAAARPGNERWLDRWSPMLLAAPGRPLGPVQLGYVAGRVAGDTTDGLPDKTVLRWLTTTWLGRGEWSAPAGAGAGPVASGPGVKPRLVISPGAPRGRPLFLYSRRSPSGARGVYAAEGGLPVAGDEEPAGPGPIPLSARLSGRHIRLAPAPDGAARLELFDAAGRRLGRPLPVLAGVAELDFDLPAGPVFARLQTASGTAATRLLAAR